MVLEEIVGRLALVGRWKENAPLKGSQGGG